MDDNPEKTLALQSVVEELGCQVVVASSGEAALRELLRQEFALALLDVQMPGMDGIELARLIRARQAHDHLTLVFMSSLDQSDERLESAYEIGAVDFISLPARRPVIKAKLAALLGMKEQTQAWQRVAGDREHSADRLRLMMDSAEGLGIFFVDTAGVIVEWSGGAEDCTGWPAEEIVGTRLSRLFHLEGGTDVPGELLDRARNQQRSYAEHWVVRKDGTRFWGRSYVVALRGSPGAGYGVLLRDISAQRAAEHQLQVKANVLENMNESVCVADESLRLVYVNSAACRTFGYAQEELLGAEMGILSDQAEDKQEECLARAIPELTRLRQWTGEWNSRRKDGSVFLSFVRISVCQQEGCRYFVAVVEDLTQRREGEAAVRRSVQLQEVVNELEAFSYSVSHDLRSPLRALRGYAEAVIGDYGEALQEPGRRYMERIRAATERLEKMVEDILAVSRIPREALALAPVDLGAVLAALAEEASQGQAAGAEIVLQGAFPPVLGHEPSLRQVFFNLLNNAVKFVPSGRRPRVVIRAEAEGAELRVWVEDNGVGIGAKDHERIFRPFERADSTQDFPGSGVGLAIVKRIAERLGGTVGVASELGTGARFWVRLSRVPGRPAGR